MWDTDVVIDTGLAALFDEASKQRCNAVGLFNTDPCLLSTEEKTIEIGRETKLASFNAYRALCGYPKLKTFQDISSKREVAEALQSCYKKPDDVELYVGLFAEDVRENGILPTLMATMVAVDAFSQALTNPLLAPENFNDRDVLGSGHGGDPIDEIPQRHRAAQCRRRIARRNPSSISRSRAGHPADADSIT